MSSDNHNSARKTRKTTKETRRTTLFVIPCIPCFRGAQLNRPRRISGATGALAPDLKHHEQLSWSARVEVVTSSLQRNRLLIAGRAASGSGETRCELGRHRGGHLARGSADDRQRGHNCGRVHGLERRPPLERHTPLRLRALTALSPNALNPTVRLARHGQSSWLPLIRHRHRSVDPSMSFFRDQISLFFPLLAGIGTASGAFRTSRRRAGSRFASAPRTHEGGDFPEARPP